MRINNALCHGKAVDGFIKNECTVMVFKVQTVFKNTPGFLTCGMFVTEVPYKNDVRVNLLQPNTL